MLLINTTQAESLLHGLEQVTRGSDRYMNVDKTELMYLKQNGSIYSLNGKSMKLVDKFIYFGSNISFAESDVNIGEGKAWITAERSLTIRKSDLRRNKTEIL